MSIITVFVTLFLAVLSASAQTKPKCSPNCPKGGSLLPGSKDKCTPCADPSAVKVQADGDPHVSVNLKRSQLDRPVCYDLIGEPWDTLRLYEVGDLKVDAQLVPSPRHGISYRNSTYFGRFVFTLGDHKIDITVASVAFINRNNTLEIQPWHPWVSKSHPVFYADGRLQIVHWKRKVIRVNFEGTTFEIKRNLLKYGVKKGVKADFFYMGIYLEKEDPMATYGGIIGDSLSVVASQASYGNVNQLTFGETTKTTVVVKDIHHYDYLHDRDFSCWMIPDLRILLKYEYDHYRI